jgi:SAM-dependent methyltransferase
MSEPRMLQPTRRLSAGLEVFHDHGTGRSSAWFDFGSRNQLRARFELTFERLGSLSGRRGLDIGCGSGIYMAEALRRGAAHVVGVDPAPGMLELARRRVEQAQRISQITLLEGYFPQTLPEGPFDFAIVIGVLDYVGDPLAFLRAIRGLVSGQTVASFPAPHWLYAPIRELRGRLRGEPVHFYDEPEIRTLAGAAGFGAIDVIRIDGAGADYHTSLAP